MSIQVSVIDYGLGNLHSVVKAFRHAGADVHVVGEPDGIASANRLVLPGVGAFGDGIASLRNRGMVDSLKAYMESGRPFLGICLGMQLLMAQSEEFGSHSGLDVIPGRVVGLCQRPGVKVPQIGWNRIVPRPGGTWRGSILETTVPNTMVYFVHSLAPAPEHEDHRLADASYGGSRICAAVQRENVVGCQFHPEKSGPAGLAILSRFLAL